tara:strand:- start:2744 stop:3181 length:438 start_codon:yes stop_codon:yes gene_type:complete
MSYLDTLKELIKKNRYRHHTGAEPVNTDKYDVVDSKTGELNFVHPNYTGGTRYNKDWMLIQYNNNNNKKKKGKVPTVEQIVERMKKKIEKDIIQKEKREQKEKRQKYKRNKSKKKKARLRKKSKLGKRIIAKKKGGRRYTKKRRR